MTREEAIKRLKEYAQYSYGIWHNEGEDTKAFDMAIEALQNLSKPNNGLQGLDLISRQDAIEAVATVTMSIHLSNVLCDKLLALPSADRPTGEVDAVAIYEKAEHDLEHNKITLGEYEKRIEPLKHLYYDRPTGEWVNTSEYQWFKCDQCGCVVHRYDAVEYKYCPRCGAKMGGGPND